MTSFIFPLRLSFFANLFNMRLRYSLRGGGMGMRGQLSAEMLVVLVVILGLAVILANTMMNSASKAARSADEKTSAVLEVSDAGAMKGASGDYCVSGADCESGSCDSYTKKCI
jgi:uncharacterized protein (UPF0333 family)